MKKETIVISGFMGFAIGVCSMMFMNIDKKAKQIEKFNETIICSGKTKKGKNCKNRTKNLSGKCYRHED